MSEAWSRKVYHKGGIYSCEDLYNKCETNDAKIATLEAENRLLADIHSILYPCVFHYAMNGNVGVDRADKALQLIKKIREASDE